MKIFKAISILMLFLSITEKICAQDPITISNGCNFAGVEDGREYYTFDPSVEAAKIVKRILDGAGALSHNSIIWKESNVKNALATTINKRRYILYSTTFLEKFKGDAKTRWAAYTVLAHEIGHHLNGHDLGEKDPKTRKQMELEADKFAGSICRTLGSTLNEALAGMESMQLEGETATHPAKSARIAAIANGWKLQDDVLANPNLDENGEMEYASKSLSGKIYQKHEGVEVILLSAKKEQSTTTFNFLIQNKNESTMGIEALLDPKEVTRTSIVDYGEYDLAEMIVLDGRSTKSKYNSVIAKIADRATSNLKVIFKNLKPYEVVPELRITVGIAADLSSTTYRIKKTLVFRNIPLPYEMKQ